jgi:NAD+ kinase
LKRVSVLTHRQPADTASTLEALARLAREASATLCFDAEETRKLGIVPAEGIELDVSPDAPVDLCIVLGGDGTILRALQRYAGTDVPVFAINFGEIGFLATIEPSEVDEGVRRALANDFELLRLPAIVTEGPSDGARIARAAPPLAAGAPRDALFAGPGALVAINDVAIHRRVGERVAEIAYGLDGAIVGSVRCDGLVVATPAGSTGYNLANGGPVMAWGVEGFVVSFIAPHSLTARALVVAPGDRLEIHNRSRDALEIAVDGRPAGEIPPGEAIAASFADAVGTIAQLPGSSFYRRLREKFGRLAS